MTLRAVKVIRRNAGFAWGVRIVGQLSTAAGFHGYETRGKMTLRAVMVSSATLASRQACVSVDW